MASRKLTNEEVIDRAQEMARLVSHVDGLREQKKEFAKSINEQVEEALDRISDLAQQVREGEIKVDAQEKLFNQDTGEVVG